MKEIVANDLSVIAARQIKKNIESNNVEHVVTPNCGEASAVSFPLQNCPFAQHYQLLSFLFLLLFIVEKF